MKPEAQRIIREVSLKYGVRQQEIMGSAKTHTIVKARHEAWRRVRIECELSLSEMGNLFHRNPSTILRAVGG